MFKFGIKKTGLLNTINKNFGVNEKAIKMRIKSVSSIEKITKAMKMVKNILKFRFLPVK